MPKYKHLEYATQEETLAFANMVRQAGGGEVISELMPSEPEQSNSCLIANALNFNSNIQPLNDANGDLVMFADGSQQWIMRVSNDELAKRIATHIGCNTVRVDSYGWRVSKDGELALKLPKRIGNVADVFDTAYEDAIYNESYDDEGGWTEGPYYYPDVWPARFDQGIAEQEVEVIFESDFSRFA